MDAPAHDQHKTWSTRSTLTMSIMINGSSDQRSSTPNTLALESSFITNYKTEAHKNERRKLKLILPGKGKKGVHAARVNARSRTFASGSTKVIHPKVS